MISKSHAFAYIHIPKCAGTSIENAIKNYCESNCFGYDHTINGHRQHANCQELVQLNSITESDIGDYFKFTFVRNPYDRCVSEYIWRIKRYGNFVNGPVNVNNGMGHPEYTKDWVRKNVSFKDFLTKNFPWKELSFNQHMRPQIDYIYGCDGNKINFIGRFENLQADFDHVCQKIFNKKIELPHKYKTNHAHYSEYYDSDAYDIVTNMYKEDILEFNYEYEFGATG